ncbi:hypothetical protein CAPTEDRAFT_193006 [Capitella teleta]|uniref:Antistasin-like domain-containing protein n=1 Tax=Capitella teleta TaxID=283909 RepID=R7TTP7_CAPTE|nr:hypothetical protein CAPTEDRAFT_193006 [Capitella teleta]|eukprot:ELT94380.1 hypothetical protein CAPTEDRAFT_193006 [Capitella teleta]
MGRRATTVQLKSTVDDSWLSDVLNPLHLSKAFQEEKSSEGTMFLSHWIVLLAVSTAVAAWPFNEGIKPQESCRPLRCQLRCEDGYVEIDGCPICKCVPGNVNKRRFNQKLCPNVKCDVKCEFGFVFEDNCKTCECRTNPCDRVECGYLQHCEVQEVLCVKEPQAICINDNICLPSNDWTLMNKCENECLSEIDCPDRRLCCNNGCGRVCSNRGVIIRKQKAKKNEDIVCDDIEH